MPQPLTGEQSVTVFNQLGFARTGLVELDPPPEMAGMPFQSVRTPEGDFPVQLSAERRWLFAASAESLGYATYYLSTGTPQPAPQTVSIIPVDENSYVLQNSFMQVGVSAASNWGIEFICDLLGPNPQSNLLG
jgi:alpha-mannosidase